MCNVRIINNALDVAESRTYLVIAQDSRMFRRTTDGNEAKQLAATSRS